MFKQSTNSRYESTTKKKSIREAKPKIAIKGEITEDLPADKK